MTDSLWKADKARICGRGGQGRGPGEVTKRRPYEIRLQECFYGIARVVYARVLGCGKLETSELCFDWERVIWR